MTHVPAPPGAGGQPLGEIFNDTITRYRKSFPQKLANLFVTLDGYKIYVSPDIAGLLRQNVMQVERHIRQRQRTMSEQGWAAAAGPTDIGATRLQHLSLKDSDDDRYVSDKFPQEMNKVAVFDHEMGHVLVWEAWLFNTNAHVSECAADAFAALRHIQRYGDRTDFLEHAAATVAHSGVAGSKIHFASAVFQKIAALQKSGKVDIANLPLEDTVKLAGRIAVDYSFPLDVLDRIRDAYDASPAVGNNDCGSAAESKAIIKVMLKHKDDEDIYRAGKLALGRADVRQSIADACASDAELKDLCAEMAKHDKAVRFSPSFVAAMDKRRAQDKRAHKPAAKKPRR